MIELEVQNSYQNKKWKSIWFWKILVVEEVLRDNINNYSIIENRKSETKYRKLKIVV